MDEDLRRSAVRSSTVCGTCDGLLLHSKELPCGHLFCFDCMAYEYKRRKRTGDFSYCQVCKSLYHTPKGGWEELDEGSLFVERLVAAERVRTEIAGRLACDLCEYKNDNLHDMQSHENQDGGSGSSSTTLQLHENQDGGSGSSQTTLRLYENQDGGNGNSTTTLQLHENPRWR